MNPGVNLLPCNGTVNYFGRTLLGKDKIIASVIAYKVLLSEHEWIDRHSIAMYG